MTGVEMMMRSFGFDPNDVKTKVEAFQAGLAATLKNYDERLHRLEAQAARHDEWLHAKMVLIEASLQAIDDRVTLMAGTQDAFSGRIEQVMIRMDDIHANHDAHLFRVEQTLGQIVMGQQKIMEHFGPTIPAGVGPTETATFSAREHQGTHPITEITCDYDLCWCHNSQGLTSEQIFELIHATDHRQIEEPECTYNFTEVPHDA